MKGITKYRPEGYEKGLYQKTDKMAREATARLKKFAKGKR